MIVTANNEIKFTFAAISAKALWTLAKELGYDGSSFRKNVGPWLNTKGFNCVQFSIVEDRIVLGSF
jgi:hypothetical protein